MKHILFFLAVMSCSQIAMAQLRPPTQTDVYAVKEVKYNCSEIRPENWPCREIHKSADTFRFADQVFCIEKSEDYGSYVKFMVSEGEGNGQQSELVFDPGNPTVEIRFSGYVFLCELKTGGELDAKEEAIPFQNLEDDANLGVEIMDCWDVEEEVVEEEAIPFQLVEGKPSFQGGDANQFSKWVNSRLVYPEICKKNGVQGHVTLQFTVEKDGSVTKVKVLRGVDPSLDREAVRVVSESPKWIPGTQRGRPVPVTYTFPVIFQLR